MIPADIAQTAALARRIHGHALRMVHHATASHIGTCLSMADILAARDLLLQNLTRGRTRYVVATSSHCHALATAIEVT